jgi:excisionase family DNA binding protein
VTETYYTIRQVAERHNVAYQTIWSMVRSGELDAVRIRTAWRIPESALAKLTIKAPVKP